MDSSNIQYRNKASQSSMDTENFIKIERSVGGIHWKIVLPISI